MKLLWLDLETTGLDPQNDIILELACTLTDFHTPFNIDKPLINYVFPADVSQYYEQMDNAVVSMHTHNGLIRACREKHEQGYQHGRRIISMEDAIIEAIGFVDSKDQDSKPILAGSTIGFDMSFLKVHMPALASKLSYRLYDITALKLICRSLGMEKIPKKEAHRAWEDVQESVAHGKMCVEWLERRKLSQSFPTMEEMFGKQS